MTEKYIGFINVTVHLDASKQGIPYEIEGCVDRESGQESGLLSGFVEADRILNQQVSNVSEECQLLFEVFEQIGRVQDRALRGFVVANNLSNDDILHITLGNEKNIEVE